MLLLWLQHFSFAGKGALLGALSGSLETEAGGGMLLELTKHRRCEQGAEKCC